MKMVMITYNEATDTDVMDVVNGCGIVSYTKMTRVYGKGLMSGTHMGDQVWPGLNNVLYVACDDAQADRIVSGVMDLRKSPIGREGIKAFVMPIDRMT